MYKEKLFTKPPFSDRLLRNEQGAPLKIEDSKGDYRYIFADGRVDWHSKANLCQSSVEITELATSRTGEVQYQETKTSEARTVTSQQLGQVAVTALQI